MARCVGKPLVECTTCRRSKKPFGRDPGAAAANGYCDRECPGYFEDPEPTSLWPGEECGIDHEPISERAKKGEGE